MCNHDTEWCGFCGKEMEPGEAHSVSIGTGEFYCSSACRDKDMFSDVLPERVCEGCGVHEREAGFAGHSQSCTSTRWTTKKTRVC